LGKTIKPPAIIELRSDLGGGKTTLVKGVAKGFGSSDRVSSPTFTINKIYKSPKGEIHHFDFYRLSEAGVVADQLAESLEKQAAITVIEWSDIVKNVLPTKRLIIELKPVATDSEERDIKITYPIEYEKIILAIESERQEIKP